MKKVGHYKIWVKKLLSFGDIEFENKFHRGKNPIFPLAKINKLIISHKFPICLFRSKMKKF